MQETEEDMADEATTQETPIVPGVFAKAYCESISYFVDVPGGVFRVDGFLSAVKDTMGKEVPVSYFLCSSKNEATDYYLDVAWRNEEGKLSLRIGVEGTHRPPDANEKEPFAEDFFQWLSQFFVGNEPLTASVNADFSYPRAVREVRVMLLPLPLKTEIGPKKVAAELDGLSLSLISKPEGIYKLWITQQPNALKVHLVGERAVDFKTFDLERDLSALSDTLDGVLEEARR